MTGPNLEPARLAVERLMDDACRVERDPTGTDDDGLIDQNTGLFVPPSGDLEPVYEGRCTFSAQQGTGREGGRGGAQFTVLNYSLSLPLEAPEIKTGDWVTWTASRRDPEAVDRRFKVQHPIYKTMAVSRRASLIAEESA